VRFLRDTWTIFRVVTIPKKTQIVPVCVYCMHAIKDGEIVGKIPFTDEMGYIQDRWWHKECRVEWLRELAQDAMDEADRLELESLPTNKED